MFAFLASLSLASAPAALAAEVIDLGWSFTEVYAIRDEHGTIIVDSRTPGDARRILRRLDAAGIDRSEVKLVLLTHGHADHAGSARELANSLRVPLAAGAGDATLMRAGRMSIQPTGARGRLVKPFIGKRFPASAADIFVDDPLDLRPYGVAGEARQVGGHTNGSVVVRLDDGALLCGDLVRGHVVRRSTPTEHFFHPDQTDAHGALTDLLDGVTVVYPGHGGPLDPAKVEDWLVTVRADSVDQAQR